MGALFKAGMKVLPFIPPLIPLRGRKRDDSDVVDSESIEDVDGALGAKVSDMMYRRPLTSLRGRKLDDSDVRDSESVEDVDGALAAKALFKAGMKVLPFIPPLIPLRGRKRDDSD